MTGPAPYTRKVRYSDTDTQGIVFNANYLVYVDDALTDWMDATGLGGDILPSHGYEIVLAHIDLDIRSSGRLGDVLDTSIDVTRIGNTSVTFTFRTVERGEGRLVTEGNLVYVIVDHQSFRPTPIPAFIRDVVAGLQGSVEA